MACDNDCNDGCEPLDPKQCTNPPVPPRERVCVEFPQIEAKGVFRLSARIGGNGTGIWNQYNADFRLHGQVEAQTFQVIAGQGRIRLAGEAKGLQIFRSIFPEGDVRLIAEGTKRIFISRPIPLDDPLDVRLISEVEPRIIKNISGQGVLRLDTSSSEISRARSPEATEADLRIISKAEGLRIFIEAEFEQAVLQLHAEVRVLQYPFAEAEGFLRLISEVAVTRTASIEALGVVGLANEAVGIPQPKSILASEGHIRLTGIADVPQPIRMEGQGKLRLSGEVSTTMVYNIHAGPDPMRLIGQVDAIRVPPVEASGEFRLMAGGDGFLPELVKRIDAEGRFVLSSTVDIPEVNCEAGKLLGCQPRCEELTPTALATTCASGCDDEIPDMIKIRDDLVLSVRGKMITSYTVDLSLTAGSTACGGTFQEQGRLKKIDEICFDDAAFGGTLDLRTSIPIPDRSADPTPVLQGFIPSSVKYKDGYLYGARRYQAPAQGYDAVLISVSPTGFFTGLDRADGYATNNPRGGFDGADGNATTIISNVTSGGRLNIGAINYPKSLYSSSEAIDSPFLDGLGETEYWVTRSASQLYPEGRAGIDVYVRLGNQLIVRSSDDLFGPPNDLGPTPATPPPSGVGEHGFRQIVSVADKIFVTYSDEGYDRGDGVFVPHDTNILLATLGEGNTVGLGDVSSVNTDFQIMFDARTSYHIGGETVFGKYVGLVLGKDKVSEADARDSYNRIVVHVQGNELQSYRILPSIFGRISLTRGPIIGSSTAIELLDKITVAASTPSNRISGKPWFDEFTRIIYYGTQDGGVGTVKMDKDGIFSELDECNIVDSIVPLPTGSPRRAFNRLYIGEYC